MDTTRLDKAIEELENAIISGDPETEKYTKMVSSLESLYKLRSGEKPSKTELNFNFLVFIFFKYLNMSVFDFTC